MKKRGQSFTQKRMFLPLILCFFLALALPSGAQETGSNDPGDLMGGIWYMPTSQWSGQSSGEGNSLRYDINNTPVTTYEGNFGSQKYGINAGIRVGK